MAKEKKSIELSDKKISFNLERVSYNVIRFFPTKMTVDVMVFEDGIKDGVKTIPFAHLPKEIKKIIKPN
ncbi:MAG: hypothetical protein A3E21_00080 [Sulfurimonas sp. RIFCSPHIGHO2_12_FULL_36_9]|uniref:hypothetical protein n=1 Tax=Sulfurimonas sp. RIFCSPLOWO2_12_36_12 TaxID=1802253 RepID=UPI0008BD29A0|nr:hypothetical protein [Sulfurimonas sp. RIFCSPLOWO2_12_36_12]OHD97137.1 MAG: hypothetical protein A3J26_04800 [Sulfurimonas sp. RIFCSPLOWO2_02_FULL_36_28]OHD97374.1 MAG: hypothetical protein A3E21_00080 [Sulfurimonas sp. RIFCSPHIGHO2_12_FULL_36_9]OHE01708.1 MAG: hypothetical protein A2W82_09330 [Sulfurimonas sp. RIFCSPLOWO2_12_36_12]OHE08008.1 MAG: hypothetical protein A3K14_05340 [Sulfurimonas sp. RIFCSPLOWO2_12_FULL_36_74]